MTIDHIETTVPGRSVAPTSFLGYKIVLIFFLFCLPCIAQVIDTPVREWQWNNKPYRGKLEGRFVASAERKALGVQDSAQILMTNGSRLWIPLEELSQSDRAYIEDWILREAKAMREMRSRAKSHDILYNTTVVTLFSVFCFVVWRKRRLFSTTRMISIYALWVFVHVMLLVFSSNRFGRFGSYGDFYPFIFARGSDLNSGIFFDHTEEYDITEFLVYTIAPLIVFMLIRSWRKAPVTIQPDHGQHPLPEPPEPTTDVNAPDIPQNPSLPANHTEADTGIGGKILSLVGSGILILVVVIFSRQCGGFVGKQAAERELAKRATTQAVTTTNGDATTKVDFEAILPEIVLRMNKSMPMTVDRDTRIDRVSSGPGRKITYHYSLTRLRISDFDRDDMITALKEQLIEGYKSNPNLKYFKDNDVTLDYSYIDADGTYFTTISVTPADAF